MEKERRKKDGEYLTPSYTRKAVSEYKKRNKTVSFCVPNETAERMAAAGIDNSVIKSLIMEELKRRENG